jgi:lipopolysaccharide/colanic/teichoic acid biosynthesis glycosyltransferase
VKRVFDFVVSASALILLSPLLLLLAALVRLSSPGPIIYRSVRLGHRGRRLEMLKFRTMVIGARDIRNPDGSSYNAAADPRVTAIGAWLRRTSLDELPQLWNVLRGEMSLVGPRPDLFDQHAFYAPEDFKRLEVKPGMTGLAQTRGRNQTTWAHRRLLDLEYVNSHSFLGDLVILARTIPGVLRGRGVYGSHKPPAPHEG